MTSLTAMNVLQSIRDQGLLPRGSNPRCIPGENESHSENKVYCNYYHPTVPDHPKGTLRQPAGPTRVAHQLHGLVYDSMTGIYSVALEKCPGQHFTNDAEYLTELSKRVQNSVCLILNKESIEENELEFWSILCRGKSKDYKDLITHLEIPHKGNIPAKHIRYVLAPLHLAPIARKVFGDKVIPVADCQADIELGLVHDLAPMLPNSRMGCVSTGGRVSLIAPDYLQGLKTLDTLLKEGFNTHAVRLPCPPDLQKQNGEKKFAIQIAPKDRDKFYRIVESPLFQVRKCFNRPNLNEFYVTCKEGDQKTLDEIVKS
ncbi:MAG: hypothetical protein LLG04_10405 [Parachlamydia sp.]|nr:hypothetical protein [Parachlamydia sp.]